MIQGIPSYLALMQNLDVPNDVTPSLGDLFHERPE